ncbi:MAG: hypothetical protein U9N62_01665 [Thermotogota bacterium]|nr:hypothetical protein [Thermotogota bacterium]
MKKTSLLVILSVVMILAFTGCLFMEKEASLEILGKKVIAFGASQAFEIKITSSGAGGVGDVFAKDAQAKSVKWDFQNTEHAEGSFTKTVEGEEAKKYTATFSTAPGDYRLSVTLVTTGDKTYEKTCDFEVVKPAPQKTIETFVGGAPILWKSIQKNDQVEIKITLTDDQLSEEQVNNYEYKWDITHSGNSIGRDSSEYIKYGDSKTYTYKFEERATYAVVLTIKNPFGDTYTFTVDSFTINTTRPEIPELVGTPDWTGEGSKFEIEVKKGEDVLYYVLEKKSPDSDQYHFVYRGFASSASTVKLYDSTVSENEVTYKIYGVDGGQSQGTPLVTIVEIPNRPPSKPVVLQPSGVVRKVLLENEPLNMFWTDGTDPDLGDDVHYYAYIGNTRDSFDYLGNTKNTSIAINYKLESGNTYYVRVDSSDGLSRTRGDVFSFTLDPDVNAPVIINSRIDMNGNPYQIDQFDFVDANGPMLAYTKTYEIEASRYASFNDSKKFKKTFTAGVITPVNVPVYIGNPGDRMFVRMRIIYENQYMKITTNWSAATLMNIR